MAIDELINTNPDAFMKAIAQKDGGFTLEYANVLDSVDPMRDISSLFQFGSIQPFAGHSLGPVFTPAKEEIMRILDLQKRLLHEGHFPKTQDISGNWFDFDINPDAIADMQGMLGFADPCEFIYTQAGLSDNLRLLLSTFYRPSQADWKSGKTGICYLSKEFYSDQAVIHSLLESEVQRAQSNGLFTGEIPCQNPGDLCMKISPDERGLYQEEKIIQFVRENAHKISILHLSDIVFSTGQRIDLEHVLTELKDVLKAHNIVVGLDLAHTVGNRTINLKKLPVTYAVGCSYKHICGSAGSGFGIYVNKDADLSLNPPIQGWKAAESNKVFPLIDGYDPVIMSRKGARAFRCSNPSPVALAPVLQYMKIMSAIGWDKLTHRSESLTRYMITLLEQRLSDRIEFITPLESKNRGAMIVFRIKNLTNIEAVEDLLKKESEFGQFELDTRPPNNVRITAHYGYTKFGDINRMIMRLEKVINLQLSSEQKMKQYQSGHILSPQESQFNQQLDLLQQKIDELTTREKDALLKSDMDIYEHLKKAKIAAITLHEGLSDAGARYFIKNDNYQTFKTTCDQLLKKAHIELDKHRGWSELLINLAIGLSTIGIGLLVKGAINLANNQSFFFVCKTKSSKMLDDLEDKIHETAPSA
ncbi:aminotransferase class V-fold PLP-dependent enzyme [Legionella quateirensis]|uniref:Aminotransferase class V n=1 Tax=Legionella quateirensis TaxID=45072 RepID=A0A378KQM4_9GAMM|nr:aminotransferase class V-fold PLP-dependent enzyme [Legionella quateirensis]KTD52487.1 Kynureninase [Legionella quateirensis]STY17194.1 aminotransferase class V [Legionella quateirensis]